MHLLLAFFRNDMGFGGNNGMTDFKDIFGFSLQADSTRCDVAGGDGGCFWGRSCIWCRGRWLTRSRFGKVLIAVRDTESRGRGFWDIGRRQYKLFVISTVSAVMCGDRRRAVCAAGGNHQSERVLAGRIRSRR